MEELQSIINQIAIQVDKHGGKMYYVGGYVRDLYLGKEPSDIDVRVIGISKEDVINAFVCSRDIRDKYLLSSMLWDIGYLDEFARWLEGSI